MEVLPVLEEPIITNEETNCPSAEDTAADTAPATTQANTDASNIVSFTSEAPVKPATVPAVEPAAPEPSPVTPPVSSIQTPKPEPRTSEPVRPQTEKIVKDSFQSTASQIKAETDDIFAEEEAPDKKRFHFKKEDKEFFRDKWILSRISDENLMDYLKLEQRRTELQQEAKDIKEKRILKAFEITVGLAAGVAVVYLLKDNPSILVNILYIAGILGALWVYKNPKDKKK